MKNSNTSLLNNGRTNRSFLYTFDKSKSCLKWSYSLSSKSGFRTLQTISWIILLSLPPLLPLFCLFTPPLSAPLFHSSHPKASLKHLPPSLEWFWQKVTKLRILKWNSCLPPTIIRPWANHFSLGLSFLTYKIRIACLSTWLPRLEEISRDDIV